MLPPPTIELPFNAQIAASPLVFWNRMSFAKPEPD
jgi:hypothetical protein